ncbi:leucine rich repeat domain-containing protein [Amanita rubescens]|nr:leucine rich repeat domain-containing protein [Amanita rubescens]
MPDGDDYIRRLAAFIRANEARFALSPVLRPKETQKWLPFQYHSPAVLSFDFYRLNYLLIRLEAHGFNVGPLDVHVDIPSHPITHICLQPSHDGSDALSLASFKPSISTITSLSLPNYWWNRTGPDSIDLDLKYIYSCFTKLPAVSIKAPRLNPIQGLTIDPTSSNALPLHVFKNIQSLECTDIDPRTFLGWNRLAESLRSLKICRSGIDDFTEIFVGVALEGKSRRGSVHSGEQISQELSSNGRPPEGSCTPTPVGNPLKWVFLRYLSLKDNAITCLPTDIVSCLWSLVHLDLSSNLLVSIPSGLDTLNNLTSLDLSDNMIDSVIGIYTQLGQVQTLNLSKNRLETICGLERLCALQRIDLRHNHIQESAEVGRLSMVSNIAEVWVDGNPFVGNETEHRLNCLVFFWREGKTIHLDGASPNFFEKKALALRISEQIRPTSSGSVATQSSSLPEASPSDNQKGSPFTRDGGSKKKIRRVVHLHAQSTNHEAEGSSLDASEADRICHLSHPSLRHHRRFRTEILSARPPDVRGLGYRDDTLAQIQCRRGIQHPDNATDGDEFRRRIEALRKDMGEGWLNVFSSQF